MSYKQIIYSIIAPDIVIKLKRLVHLKSVSVKVSKKSININSSLFFLRKSIERLVYKKIKWIKKQLFILSKTKSFEKKKYTEGENFLYLGKKYKLKIIINKKKLIYIDNDCLIVEIKDKFNTLDIKKFIKEWFFEKSNSYFKEQTYNFAKVNNLNINSIKVKDYKARWGSCSYEGDISFNFRLIMAPPKIIEYVIVHELMHLKEHNHSPKFWGHVKLFYPNIKDAKEWLMYNGQTLNI